MSRTYRKAVWAYFREPRGNKQAQILADQGLCRQRAVPPSAWDDFSHSHEALLPARIVHKMAKRGVSREKAIRFLKRRFKYTTTEAEETCWKGWWKSVQKIYYGKVQNNVWW